MSNLRLYLDISRDCVMDVSSVLLAHLGDLAGLGGGGAMEGEDDWLILADISERPIIKPRRMSHVISSNQQ